MDLASALERDSPIAVELDFVEEVRAVRQLVRTQQEHGLDEFRLHGALFSHLQARALF